MGYDVIHGSYGIWCVHDCLWFPWKIYDAIKYIFCIGHACLSIYKKNRYPLNMSHHDRSYPKWTCSKKSWRGAPRDLWLTTILVFAWLSTLHLCEISVTKTLSHLWHSSSAKQNPHPPPLASSLGAPTRVCCSKSSRSRRVFASEVSWKSWQITGANFILNEEQKSLGVRC